MELNDTDLIHELERMDASGAVDPRALDGALALFESNTPARFRDLLGCLDVKTWSEFRERAARLLSMGPDASKVSEDSVRLCLQFLLLIGILQHGQDSVSLLLPLAEDADSLRRQGQRGLDMPAARSRTERDPVDHYIEVALMELGHIHRDGIGLLDEEIANRVYQTLSLLWADSPQFVDWLVPYLSIRLTRSLANVDLFHAMHTRLPHYREFKILAYLLQLLGRDGYQFVGQFSDLANRLYYDISKKCGQVFNTEQSMEQLEKAVFGMLAARRKECSDLATKAIAASRESGRYEVRPLVIRITARFFRWYIGELSEAGQLHVVLWSLPMFEQAKQAFQSVVRFGTEGTSILIIGETGTGKESIAKLFLTTLGDPYVVVNCAGKTWKDLYDDLFMTKEGAPPLVSRIRAILLDELDRAQLDAQGGILRFLDKPYGEIREPGQLASSRWHGFTVATATSRVYEDTKSGLFLPDLFWRFDMRAHISPLRERASQGDSFRRLFKFAVGASAAKFGIKAPVELEGEQYESLKQYEWPGNLREMLEFADSLVKAVAMDSRSEMLESEQSIRVPAGVFREVMSHYEYFAYMIAR